MSQYRGSATTFALVRAQIANRFGEAEAEAYDPNSNCLTLPQWNSNGYKIKKGEKAIKSYTFVEKEDESKNKTRYRKIVFLFYYTQVEKIADSAEIKS